MNADENQNNMQNDVDSLLVDPSLLVVTFQIITAVRLDAFLYSVSNFCRLIVEAPAVSFWIRNIILWPVSNLRFLSHRYPEPLQHSPSTLCHPPMKTNAVP